MTRLRNALATLLAVVLVLCGAYVMGGVVARRAADRERDQADAERIRHTQDELEAVRNEVIALDKEHAAGQLRADWVRD